MYKNLFKLSQQVQQPIQQVQQNTPAIQPQNPPVQPPNIQQPNEQVNLVNPVPEIKPQPAPLQQTDPNSQNETLRNKVNNALSNLSDLFISDFKNNFADEIMNTSSNVSENEAWKLLLDQAIDNFFTQQDRSRMTKWINFTISMANKFKSTSGMTPEDLMNDAITNQMNSKIYKIMTSMISKKSPELWNAIEINAKKLNKAENTQNSISINNPMGSDGDEMGNLIADTKEDAPDIDISSEDISTLNGIAETFLKYPDNTVFLKEILQKSRARNQEKLLENSVKSAFIGIIRGGAKWMVFFQNNPHLLPAHLQKLTGLDLEKALSDKNVKAMCFKTLEQLASWQGNAEDADELNTFIQDMAKAELMQQIENQHIDFMEDLKGLPKQVGKIGKDAYTSLAFNLFYEKSQLQNLLKDPQKNRLEIEKVQKKIKDIGIKFALVKSKSKSIEKNLDSQLFGEKTEYSKGLGDEKGSYVLKLRNEKGKGGGRLVMEHGGVEEPLKFSRIQNIAMTEEWIPNAIKMMNKMSYDGTAPGCNKRTETLMSKYNVPSDVRNEYQSAEASTPEDPTIGWRKKLAEKLNLISGGRPPEEVAKIIFPPKQNAKKEDIVNKKQTDNIINMFKGKDFAYNDKLMEKIAIALNVPPSQFYIPPSVYDKNNKDDISNLSGQTNNAFQSYGQYLVKKKQVYKERFNQSPYSTTALMLYVGMMGTHSTIGQGNPTGPFGPNPSKILYNLIPRPVATDKSGKPHTIDKVRQNMGLTPEQSFEEYAKPNISLPPSPWEQGTRQQLKPQWRQQLKPQWKEHVKSQTSILNNFLKAIEAEYIAYQLMSIGKQNIADSLIRYASATL